MRLKTYFRWELVLALSLVGCTSVVPNQLGLPQLTKGGTSGASSVITQKSTLFFQVRWPERKAYSAQALPDTAVKLEVQIKAKDGTPIDGITVNRPEGATSVSDVKFQLDPALKVVDIIVRALDASGAEVASGKVLDVRIRDNTATGVTVTLVAGTSQEAQQQLDIRINKQLALLHNVRNYFQRFDHFQKYGESAEARDLNAAVQAILQNAPFKPEQRQPDPYYTPYPYMTPDPNMTPDPTMTPPPGSTTTKSVSYGGYVVRPYSRIGIRSAETPPQGAVRLSNPNDPTQYMDILNGVLDALYWPGYSMGYSYADIGGGKHTAGLAIASGNGGDGSSANVNVEVTAGTWVPEPSFTVELDGMVNGTRATESLTFLGGLKPDERTLSMVAVRAGITPKGIATGSYKVAGALDEFRDISASPYYKLAQDNLVPKNYYYPMPTAGSPTAVYPSPQPAFILPTYLPTHGRVVAHAPSAQATADIRVNGDMLGVQTHTELRVADNLGAFSEFLLDLGVSTKIGSVGGRPAIVSGDFGFALVDKDAELKLEGVVHGDMTTQKATVTARFVDVPSNTVIGTLDWIFDPKGDPNHLDFFPLLKLQDGEQYRLTPGFFTGETTGNVHVDVR